MDHKSSTSAILDVVIENKDISTILKDSNKDNDRSSLYSNSTLENSLVQSPSLESFSTLPDTEILSELNVDENSDLCIKVDNPQKHLDTLETYITFRITTRVARIEFSENEYVVRRRYNEFVWLRQKLIDCHPFCIIPPLPGKHTLIGQLDRYSRDFILVRMKLLNTFMSRLVQHPILSCSEHFKVFITASQSDFSLYRKNRSNSNHKINFTNNSLSARTSVKIRHTEFEKTRDYLNILTEKLISIEKISSRINKERHDFIVELQNFYPIFSNWSITEPELAQILQNIANAIEKSTYAQNGMICNYSNTVANPIKEFLIYIDVVKETLHKRELYQQVYEISMEELSKKRTEKDQLLTVQNSSAHGAVGFSLWRQPSYDEKLEKLGIYIPQLVKKVETNQDNLECANESLRSDLDRWNQEKQRCIKKILLDFVNKQIEYYEKNVNAWENVAIELNFQNISLRNSTKK